MTTSVRRRLWWIFAWFTLALVPSCIRPWPTRRTWDTRDLAIGNPYGKTIASCRYPDFFNGAWFQLSGCPVIWLLWPGKVGRRGVLVLALFDKSLSQTVEGFGRDVFLESEVMSKQIIGSFKQPRPFCWISFAEYPTQQTQVTSNHVNILCQCQHPAPLRCAFMSLTTCSST